MIFLSISYWARSYWYNIFPDRFYNSNKYNDPLFNELGAKFSLNSNSEFKFIEKYRWNKEENSLLFELNRWTSDFSERKKWKLKWKKELITLLNMQECMVEFKGN